MVFLDQGFNFQPDVCKGCHNVLMMCINLNNIAISKVWGVDYSCIINGISKSEAVNILQNVDLTKQRRVL